MSYSDFKRGRRCPDCADSRRAKTNLGRYGVVNPFESAVVKEKIKETCLKKYGETHHMKVEEIRKKAEQTNMVKIGVKYSFHTPQSFEKIRKTCLLRYGVQFPLQSEFIQAKITQKWLEKIGAGRPMTNQTYWKQCMVDKYGVDHYSKSNHCKIACLDKYGVDHYSKTDQFKIDYANTCLDKYGVDHYSKTDQFKIDYANTCLDKYGVDHPMKTIEIFQKATRNSFCRKPFVYPSGRVDYILGYEGVAIFELLDSYNERDIITSVWCIPTFKYKRVSSEARPLLNKEYAMSVYFPDILLPDKIIEVKSAYLYKRDKQNVIEKMKAVAQTGYKGELWVYKSHKKLWFKKEFVLVGEHIVITKI
jgi:galactitol-specific phosphotransferase system IIB component